MTWVESDKEWIATVGPSEEVFGTFDELAAFVSWVDDGCPEPDEHPEYARAWGLVDTTPVVVDPEHVHEHETIVSQAAKVDGLSRRQQAKRSAAARRMLLQHLRRFHGGFWSDAPRRSLEAAHARLHEEGR